MEPYVVLNVIAQGKQRFGCNGPVGQLGDE